MAYLPVFSPRTIRINGFYRDILRILFKVALRTERYPVVRKMEIEV